MTRKSTPRRSKAVSYAQPTEFERKMMLPDDEEGDDDPLIQARKEFERCRDAWRENQELAKDDLKFARLGQQWPLEIEQQRRRENRPCLTFNKMPAFIRQVVNDARQNRPSIKVHPQDSGADKRVAEIYDGLIRNIEVSSDADVATDTAIEHAVGQGFGFWRYNIAFTSDDSFEKDIVVERVANPFTVYGDPRSTAADSSDWDVAFVVTTLTRDEFEAQYPDAEKVDWEHDFRDCPDWLDGDDVVVAEWWQREKVQSQIVQLSDGTVERLEDYQAHKDDLDAAGVTIVGQPRTVESHKVTQRIMSGAEVLSTTDWAGKYIPIVPVYGDEVIDEDGKRWFRSLIRDAKSAQQMFNYWRTTTTELIALAPKAPWIGPEGAFDSDPNWDTANSVSHSKLEYHGAVAPQRQPFSGVPAGALQEALNANDDMKAIIGIYDASLGARSNETSGKAIMARQREGDVSTFHFIDNLSRAIRHGGRILLDLIPKVYSTQRMIRVLGESLKPDTVQNVQIAPSQTGQAVTPIYRQPPQPGAAPMPAVPPTPNGPMPPMGAAAPVSQDDVIGHIYDLTVGKYDLTVTTGPSFTTRREEAREGMQEMMQADPQIIPIVGDIYVEAQDWPMADQMAERLKRMVPPQALGQGAPGIPPQVQQQMQQGMQTIQQQGQQLQQMQQEIAALNQQLKDKGQELQIKAQAEQTRAYEAETRRMEAMQPQYVRAPAGQTM